MSFFVHCWEQSAAADADFYRAYRGTYTAPGGQPVPDVRVLMDSAVQFIGEYGTASIGDEIAQIAMADVPTPVPGATLNVGSVTYTLDRLVDRDPGGATTWSLTL